MANTSPLSSACADEELESVADVLRQLQQASTPTALGDADLGLPATGREYRACLLELYPRYAHAFVPGCNRVRACAVPI